MLTTPRDAKPDQSGLGGPAVACRMHGERGGAPEGKRNGNYPHGGRTKEIIELWKLIKSLR
jgi:hypothetical protein